MEFPAQPVTPVQTVIEQNKAILSARARRGTDWFFWIAGLSVANTIAALFGAQISFVAGLAITQFIIALAYNFTQNATDLGRIIVLIIAVCINLGIVGLFVLAGFLARKHYRWVVIVGMVLYALDGLVYLLFQEWVSAVFHGWALWGLWNGLQNLNQRNALEQSSQLTPPQL